MWDRGTFAAGGAPRRSGRTACCPSRGPGTWGGPRRTCRRGRTARQRRREAEIGGRERVQGGAKARGSVGVGASADRTESSRSTRSGRAAQAESCLQAVLPRAAGRLPAPRQRPAGACYLGPTETRISRPDGGEPEARCPRKHAPCACTEAAGAQARGRRAGALPARGAATMRTRRRRTPARTPPWCGEPRWRGTRWSANAHSGVSTNAKRPGCASERCSARCDAAVQFCRAAAAAERTLATAALTTTLVPAKELVAIIFGGVGAVFGCAPPVGFRFPIRVKRVKIL